jgi:signal peptidase I
LQVSFPDLIITSINFMKEKLEERLPEPGKRPSLALRQFFLELLETVVLAVILYFGIDAIVARVRVENVSMQPTLIPGEFLMVNRLAYHLGKPKYGDIVVFHYDPTEDYIKRIIGLPGDLIEVKEGTVYVNHQAFIEPYIAAKPNYTGRWAVPEKSIFVLGDNRNNSEDSHVWGFVAMRDVIGKAIVIYWPLDKARLIKPELVISAEN